MSSPHQTRSTGGGTKSASRVNTSSRYGKRNGGAPADSRDDDSYDVRADLKLSRRQKSEGSPRKQQQQAVVRQQQKKKVSKSPRKKSVRSKEKEYKSGTELLESLGAVGDADAQAAADALGRDLELMGYDLDCETFITRGSSEASIEEDRYASQGLGDTSQKSRSASGNRNNRYAMDDGDDEDNEEKKQEEHEEEEEDIEEEDEENPADEGMDESTAASSVDVRDALNSTRDEISSGLVKDTGSYQSVASETTVSSSASKTSPVREKNAIRGKAPLALPSKTNRSRKVLGDQKASKLVSRGKGLSKANDGAPMSATLAAVAASKKRDTKRLPRTPVQSTSKPKALPPATETPEQDPKAVVIEGMSIFNEEGGVSVAPSTPVDFWDNQDTKGQNANLAPKREIAETRDEPQIAQKPSYYPVQEKKRSWLPFRRTSLTRQKAVLQSEKKDLLNVKDGEQAERDFGGEELKTQQAPAPALTQAPVLTPAPAPDAITATDSDASACEISDLPPNLLVPPVTKPKRSRPAEALFDVTSGVGTDSDESNESDEKNKGGVSKNLDDEAPTNQARKRHSSKKVIRVAVDPERREKRAVPLFSMLRRNKKTALIKPETRRMDAIQENEDGFDVELIEGTGTVGTLYQSVESQNQRQKAKKTVKSAGAPVPVPVPAPDPAPAPVTVPVPVPVPVPIPAMANKKKSQGEGIRSGTARNAAKAIYEPPLGLYDEGAITPIPKLARTFSDFVEAIFSDTPKQVAPVAPRRAKNVPPTDGSVSSSRARMGLMHDEGPPQLVLADTHLTDISPPEESPITKTLNDMEKRKMRVLGFSPSESLLDQDPGVTPNHAKVISPEKNIVATEPAQREIFFQRRTPKTAAVPSKPKLNYPVKNGQDERASKFHNKAPLQLQRREKTPVQRKKDPQWRTRGQPKQQEEIPPPPMEALEKINPKAMETIPARRYPSALTEPSSAEAAVGSSLGLGPLPTFLSEPAVAADAQQSVASQASSVAGTTTVEAQSNAVSDAGNTWNEIVDASRVVGKAFKSVELGQSNDTEDRFDTLMSFRSDDSSLGDVERALEVLKKHANRLGVRESDLLQSLKTDEDTLLQRIRSKTDIKSNIKSVDESLLSGNVSGVLSGDDDESIRSLTLAEELMSAFQLYTGGINPTRK